MNTEQTSENIFTYIKTRSDIGSYGKFKVIITLMDISYYVHFVKANGHYNRPKNFILFKITKKIKKYLTSKKSLHVAVTKWDLKIWYKI